MIYTRFGQCIEILDAEIGENGNIWVQVRYESGMVRERNIMDLKADEGVDEIMQTIKRVCPDIKFYNGGDE